jgi:hypothetical protein
MAMDRSTSDHDSGARVAPASDDESSAADLGAVAGASFEERANLDRSGTENAPSEVAELGAESLDAPDSDARDALASNAHGDDPASAPSDDLAASSGRGDGGEAAADRSGGDEPTHD